MSDNGTLEGWVILELFGHRRLAGYLREQEVAGGKFLRLDVPDAGTQFYGAAAVYCITPTSEETARRVASLNRPAPVQRWELPREIAAEPDEFETPGDDDELLWGGE